MDFPLKCDNPGAMQALGRDLAGELAAGGVVGLDGDLGAGKTELVKGLAAGMGCEGAVTSPTFAILQEYRAGARNLCDPATGHPAKYGTFGTTLAPFPGERRGPFAKRTTLSGNRASGWRPGQ